MSPLEELAYITVGHEDLELCLEVVYVPNRWHLHASPLIRAAAHIGVLAEAYAAAARDGYEVI